MARAALLGTGRPLSVSLADRMRISEVAPTGWDDGIAFPMLSTAFARASRTLGQRPFYLTDGVSRALVLLRSLPGPLVSWWTSRAKVYVDAARPDFVTHVIDALRARGVSYARIGDAAWGVPALSLTGAGLRRLTTHLMTLDPTRSEADALAQLSPKTRWQLRRSQREGVKVEAITTDRELGAFCELVEETGDRMRARDLGAALPAAFYRAVFQEMVPRGEALFVLAQAGTRALAGGLFFVSPQRMSYYHGASTRDRAVTALNGPTAMFWYARHVAGKRGIAQFDLGAVTPTDDPAHPHHSVYHFKRGFGGQIAELHSGEVMLSPLRCRFQELVVLPAWKRMYPLYLSLVGRAA